MTSPSSRRAFLRTTGLATALTALAGCNALGTESTPTYDDPDVVTANPTETPGLADETPQLGPESDTETATATAAPEREPLTAGGSSTVYPVANSAAAYWNANPTADDAEYWPHDEYDIDTDQNLANYWAGKYGFPPGDRAEPPFQVTVGLSHSETGLEKLRAGQVDLGNASTSVEAALPDLDATTYDRFVDHVVAVDAAAVVVSAPLTDEGVTELTGKELAAIYEGSVTNWSAVGGPDRETEVLGRHEGSGTRTAFAAAVLGDPAADTATDATYDPSQRLAVAVAESDAAIGYLSTAFAEYDGVEPVALNWRGTTYELDGDPGFGASGYPLARDLHLYSWAETSPKEAAFLRMLRSDFGQGEFVAANDYHALSERRRREQRAKLPPAEEDGEVTATATPVTTVPEN